jgi:hypothetical protein
MRLVGSFRRVKKRGDRRGETKKAGNKIPGSDVSSIAFP